MAAIDLHGKVAFVTGAAGGIGKATTLAFLEAGCTVVGNVRLMNESSLAFVADVEAKHGDRFIISEGSVSDSTAVENAAKMIFKRFKRVDIVVNNAGIQRDAYIGMITDELIQAVLETNLVGVIKVSQTMARLMKRQKSGSIINVASIIGLRGNTAQLVYGASKAGVIGATLSLAKELAPLGIRANAVAPGLIDTPLTAALPTQTLEAFNARIGMGRIGTASEVADAILFLASDLSRYVTGQVLGVDGGLVL